MNSEHMCHDRFEDINYCSELFYSLQKIHCGEDEICNNTMFLYLCFSWSQINVIEICSFDFNSYVNLVMYIHEHNPESWRILSGLYSPQRSTDYLYSYISKPVNTLFAQSLIQNINHDLYSIYSVLYSLRVYYERLTVEIVNTLFAQSFT